MSIIPVSCLSSSDLAQLGNNLTPKVQKDRRELQAVNRSLAGLDEGVFGVADVTGEDHVARQRRRLIEAAGGSERVQRVMDFARWFCQQLMDGYADASICSVTLAPLMDVNAIATWSAGDVLTLGIDTPWLWSDPLGEETLATLIHEVAHHLNAHHGHDFHQEVEKLAGRAAAVMLHQGSSLRQHFAALLPLGGASR